MIRAVFDATRTHMFEDVAAILERSMTAQEALGALPKAPARAAVTTHRQQAHDTLVELITYLLDGSSRYPELTKAQAQQGLNSRGTHPLREDFERLVPQVAVLVRTAENSLSLETAALRATAALSSVLFLGFFADFFGASSPSTPATRSAYIDTSVDGLVTRGG